MMTLSTVVEKFLRFRQSGYQMVDSISIRNFRSFRKARSTIAVRVNILVGDNGSGKTALLEALFLAAGVSPELAIRTRSWRGYEGDRMAGSHEDLHQALWADLFHKFETNRTAVIALRGRVSKIDQSRYAFHRPRPAEIDCAQPGPAGIAAASCSPACALPVPLQNLEIKKPFDIRTLF